MATKQEKAVQRAVAKEHKAGKEREEKHILWILVAIILALLYLLLAQHYSWWPYARPTLGSAFYTNVSANTTKPSSGTTGKSGTSTGSTSGGGSSQGSSAGSSSGGNGSTSGGGSTSSSTPSIARFAADINVGDTKAHTSAEASGLNEHCAVVATAQTSTTLGKQEVCAYTQGDKIVTVTYLSDHVVSASKSGF